MVNNVKGSTTTFHPARVLVRWYVDILIKNKVQVNMPPDEGSHKTNILVL